MISDVVIHDSSGKKDDISDRVLALEVELSMDAVSQLTIDVSDPGLAMLKANYFQLRRELRYLGMSFEISAAEVQQMAGGEGVRLECRSRPCQLLKRDKGAKTFNVGSATAFAGMMARDKGIQFFGEKSTSKGTISRVHNTTTDESSWDVLRRLASENQFMLFETDGRLFFTTQQFLLGKFALVGTGTNAGFLATPILWLEEPDGPRVIVKPKIAEPSGQPLIKAGTSYPTHVRYVQTVLVKRAGQAVPIDGFYGTSTRSAIRNLQTFFGVAVTGNVDQTTWAILKYLGGEQRQTLGKLSIKALSCPEARHSDDDPNAATVTFDVDRTLGRQLRPGMTIYLADIPNFQTNYLINEVSWKEGTNSAVSVSARTPQEPGDLEKAAELRKRIDLTGGGFATITVDDAFVLN